MFLFVSVAEIAEMMLEALLKITKWINRPISDVINVNVNVNVFLIRGSYQGF